MTHEQAQQLIVQAFVANFLLWGIWMAIMLGWFKRKD